MLTTHLILNVSSRGDAYSNLRGVSYSSVVNILNIGNKLVREEVEHEF